MSRSFKKNNIIKCGGNKIIYRRKVKRVAKYILHKQILNGKINDLYIPPDKELDNSYNYMDLRYISTNKKYLRK